jgi:hypothetical protein
MIIITLYECETVSLTQCENTQNDSFTEQGAEHNTVNLVNLKPCNSKIHDISNSSLNLDSKGKKYIQICLVISKTLINCDLKEKMSCSNNFHIILSK